MQLRYNVPIEILYTVVPLFMIGGALLLHRARRGGAARRLGEARRDRQRRRQAVELGLQLRRRQQVYEAGTQAELDRQAAACENDAADPYLPVNKRVEFVLTSRDVIHSFWVPAFL